MLKVGDILYEAGADPEEDGAKSWVWEWHVRSVRKGFAHLTRKDEWTWVKRSPKTGDYGWASYISHYDRRKESAAADLTVIRDLARTPTAAIRKAIAQLRKRRDAMKKPAPNLHPTLAWSEEHEALYNKSIALLEQRLKRAKKAV